MVVILNVKVTGSAEIVVSAGSSSDPNIVIANLLGTTVASALEKILARGYVLSFVTENMFVCAKPQLPRGQRGHNVTLFGQSQRAPKKSAQQPPQRKR
ncbi:MULTISPECIES: hypothetical protein [Alicyclobacillus]|uniref:Uncharacterized protein n=1 Tax=Alicyclobacillus acidoterrestris (strain ATCC 49025 / DSM 3922 / CIP 106132 / NCIMB 13137 / GD3B) TaxID=1356854 RepID=T0C3T5_ALIAG|nr:MULTISPECIES: hypothetical protein [Alicyclobacillus]EPZ50903.1 hypothetical protein N007_20985 [Alicyclobacillus acidoterrestris ATCC 49025]UNO49008.1 hypothetical protein K1I37_00065 [Alicyclobacillus acidoterrestris]